MSELKPANPLIVLVGCPRSGTTLLRTMLDNHPDITAHPDEPQFFLGLYQRFGKNIGDVKAAIEYVAQHPYFPASLERHALRTAYDGIESTSLQSFIDIYLNALRSVTTASSWLLVKHPELVFHLDLVDDLFPESVLLHIVRDPRSTVFSRRNRWPQFTVWESALLWRNAVRRAKRWGMQNPNRYQEVKYEKLVQEPDLALSALLKMLGLPVSHSVLTFEHRSTVYADGQPVDRVVYTKPDPSRVNLWKSHLTPLEIRKIEYCCKSGMLYWNYEPLSPPVTRPVFILSVLFDHLRHLFFSSGRSLKSGLRQLGWRLGYLSR